MDIRQLEAFVYTAKYQSFSLAAQKLYLSQPTVSSHICNLEKELHTQLLQRTTKALSMTPAGRRLYSYAAEILDLRHKAILELTSQQEATLHIGVSSVPSLHLLPELLAAYHAQAPEVRFRTSCSDSLDVIRRVSEGGCDIGLAGTKTAAPGCGFLPVTSDELVLAARNIIRPGSGRHEPDHCPPSPHAHSSFSNCSKKRNSVSPLIASARTHTPCTARSAHIIPSP